MQLAPVKKDARRLHLRKQAGLWLKQKREEAGLTQRDLAAILDLKIYTFISQVESGNGRLPFDRYSDWARALKLDEYDFAAKALSYYEPALFELVLSGSPRKPDTDI